MTVLVTGGAGFIGSHFIELLLRQTDGRRVICLDNFNAFYDPAMKRANVARFAADPRVTVVEQSFEDEQGMRRLIGDEQVREIVHLGAHAGVRASISNPAAYEQNNVQGTRALLDAARAAPISRFLLVSSSTVYGSDARVPFEEDAPLGVPLSPYGASKRAAELLALAHYQQHQTPVVCLRPFSVYGPRIRPDLAPLVFAAAIDRGVPLPLYGDGSIRRDFTHVSDICEGLWSALTAEGAVGEIINLGHHEPVAIRTLIEMLEEALGRKATIDHRPAVAADMPLTCADLSKARRLLGYKPAVSLRDGVSDFVAWFRAANR